VVFFDVECRGWRTNKEEPIGDIYFFFT
jgi:hypothetical protein